MLSHEAFFDWLKGKLPLGKLEQKQVDSMNKLLSVIRADVLKEGLDTLLVDKYVSDVVVPNVSSKTLTKAQVVDIATELGVEPAAMKAVIDVESAGKGFDNQGRPIILFEPHIFWRELGKIHYYTKRSEYQRAYAGLLSPRWDKSLYRVGGSSHDKLKIASELNWDAAHKSASFGLPQIMGFNYSSIGYDTLKEFVDDMYESEAKQLKAMGMFLRANNLISKLQKRDWAGFARGYNGSGYAANKYDTKLAAAYSKAKREGW